MILTGFQLQMLLGIADHEANAEVVIAQYDGRTHARRLDSSVYVYLPKTGAEAEDIEREKRARAEQQRVLRETLP